MSTAGRRVSTGDLQRMKRDRRKIVGVVAWDYQMARIVDRAGVEIVSVGDTVGVNLWGRSNPLDVTMDEMVLVAQAVRRGVERALLSCDFPFGPLQEGPAEAVRAAIRLAREAGVDMVKLDGAADHPEAVEAVTRAGIPVFAQFGITPQTPLDGDAMCRWLAQKPAVVSNSCRLLHTARATTDRPSWANAS